MDGARNLAEAGVSAKELVSAETAEGDFKTEMAGELADEIGVDAVDGGLIHGVEEVFAVGDEVGAVDVLDFLLEVQVLGDLLGERDLVEGGLLHFVEAEGEGMDVFSGELGGEGCDGSGVAAGGEECGYRDVGAEMHGQRFEEDLMETGEHFRAGARGVVGVLGGESVEGRIECVDSGLLTGSDLEIRAGRQGMDASKESVRLRDGSPEIEAGVACRIGRQIGAGNVGEGLDLGGEGKKPGGGLGCRGPVEGLDAERVAGEGEFLLVVVPDGNGEHAAQAGKHGGAIFGKEGENNFSIAGGAEGVAARDELSAELLVVVDFAVEDEDVATVGRMHGLIGAGCGVENGEAGVREEEMVIGIAP